MKIERIDDKTVKCFLSNEELEEYDIDYKDFLTRSDKAKEVVQEIIHQATEEVGYKPPRFAFDLQIMMLPDQGLLLTFSEKEPMDIKDGAQLIEYLKEMKKALQQTQQSLEAQVGKTPVQNPEQVIFAFEDLGTIMDLAKLVPGNLRVRSAVYVMDGRYYLHLHKGAAAYERYSKMCIQAMEFGSIYGAEEDKLLYLQEHGECIIEERALRKLHMK
ncbi:MAG: adaptor protein MecA [Roseburia sp.]|nr:adaptor protein MecA [Roseburia sp.]